MSTTTVGSSSVARLVSRTSIILGGQVGLAWLGSLATWSMQMTTASFWAMTTLFMASALGSSFWGMSADSSDPSPVLGAAVFAFVTGAYIGPVMAMHTEQLGPAVVGAVCAASIVGLAAAGTIGALASFDWRKAESWLIPALWGLIGFHLVGALLEMPAGLDRVVSLGGAGLFLLFAAVDVARMLALGSAGEDGWGTAVVVANNLFLDLVNIVLHLLASMGD